MDTAFRSDEVALILESSLEVRWTFFISVRIQLHFLALCIEVLIAEKQYSFDLKSLFFFFLQRYKASYASAFCTKKCDREQAPGSGCLSFQSILGLLREEDTRIMKYRAWGCDRILNSGWQKYACKRYRYEKLMLIEK